MFPRSRQCSRPIYCGSDEDWNESWNYGWALAEENKLNLFTLFIRKGGTIDYEVTDPNRKYSRDLPQGGLEIPCVLTLRGTKDLVDKAVKLLAISIFRNLYVITKILCYENLEPYGIVFYTKVIETEKMTVVKLQRPGGG